MERMYENKILPVQNGSNVKLLNMYNFNLSYWSNESIRKAILLVYQCAVGMVLHLQSEAELDMISSQ